MPQLPTTKAMLFCYLPFIDFRLVFCFMFISLIHIPIDQFDKNKIPQLIQIYNFHFQEPNIHVRMLHKQTLGVLWRFDCYLIFLDDLFEYEMTGVQKNLNFKYKLYLATILLFWHFVWKYFYQNYIMCKTSCN